MTSDSACSKYHVLQKFPNRSNRITTTYDVLEISYGGDDLILYITLLKCYENQWSNYKIVTRGAQNAEGVWSEAPKGVGYWEGVSPSPLGMGLGRGLCPLP